MALDLFNKKMIGEIKSNILVNVNIDINSINIKNMARKLKIIKEADIRTKVYAELYYTVTNEELLNGLDEILNLYKSHKELCVYCLNNSINILKHFDTIKLFEDDILSFNLTDIGTLEQNKDIVLKYKQKYSNEEMRIILKNFITYNEILSNPECDKINNSFLFCHIEEVKFIFNQPEDLKEVLIDKANNYNFEDYLNIKDKIKKVSKYSSEIRNFIIYNNFEDNLINELEKIESERFIIQKILSTYKSPLFKKYNDYIILTTSDINELKTHVYYKYFGVHYSESKRQISLLEKYNVKLSDDVINNIKILSRIDHLNDIESIKKELSNFRISGTEVQNHLKQLHFFEKKYDQTLYKPSNDNSNRKIINYNNKQIEYIESDLTDFNMLVSRITYARRGSENGKNGPKFAERLLNDPSVFTSNEVGSDILSTSYISEINLTTFGESFPTYRQDVILGFDNCENNRIIITSTRDGASNMDGAGNDLSEVEKLNTVLRTPESLKKACLYKNMLSYNEVSISRIENGAKKKPNFILVLKNVTYPMPLNESALKYASYYNIPIVEIDGKKLFVAKSNQLKEKLNYIKQKKSIAYVDFEDIISYMFTMYNTCFDGSDFNYVEVLDSITNYDFDMSQINETIKILEHITTPIVMVIEKEEYFKNKLKTMLLKKEKLENNKTNDNSLEMLVNNGEMLNNEESKKQL